jgi:outer membrane protein
LRNFSNKTTQLVKQKSFILPIAACLVGMMLLLQSCKDANTAQNAAAPVAGAAATAAPSGKSLSIVYVNLDTLVGQYQYVKDLKVSLEAEGKRAQASLETKAKTLQAKVVAYQKNVQAAQQAAETTPRVELERLQKEFAGMERQLQQEEQEIGMQRQNAAAGLAQKEADLMKKLKEKLDSTLKRISTEKGYDYILAEGNGGAVLFGNKGMNITTDVLSVMNADYATEKNKK